MNAGWTVRKLGELSNISYGYTEKAVGEPIGPKFLRIAGEQLAEVSRMINAEKSDLFDVLAYIAYALAPITRSERVETHRADIFSRYDGKLQSFLDFVLGQYIKQGVGELDQEKLGALLQLKYHTIDDAASQLGSVPLIRETFLGFQRHLYAADN